MANRVSDVLFSNPWPLLLDNYPFIVSLVHEDGSRTFQGFHDFDDALKPYRRHPHSNKAIYVVRTLIPKI